jgi:hypothetical protein
MMHTFVRYLHNQKHEVWAVGYFIVASGESVFVPLFDVATQNDALVAVNVLNGGGPTQNVSPLRLYEGIAPHAEITISDTPTTPTTP